MLTQPPQAAHIDETAMGRERLSNKKRWVIKTCMRTFFSFAILESLFINSLEHDIAIGSVIAGCTNGFYKTSSIIHDLNPKIVTCKSTTFYVHSFAPRIL